MYNGNYFDKLRTMSSSEMNNTVTSPQMRKYILRSALKTAQTLSENVNKNTIANLECVMDKTDMIAGEANMEEIVNDHEEVVLDAHVIYLSSQIMKRCSVNVTKEINNYDFEEFATNIKTYLTRQSNTHTHDEKVNWALLENEVFKIFRTLPKFKSLQGTMNSAPVEEVFKVIQSKLEHSSAKKSAMEPLPAKEALVKRQIRRLNAKVPTKRPQCVTVSERAEESVEDSVEKIRRLVISYYENNSEPLHFFKLVIHPTNFGRTVENLLHTSFLIRDGILKLVKNEKKALLVKVVPKKELHEAKKAGNINRIQNVFSINQKQWKILTEAYNITEPMIDFVK